MDGRVISASFGNDLTEITKEKNGELCFHEDLPDAVWSDRPTLTSHPLFILEEKYTGQSAADKLTAIRNDMKEHGADIHLVASLDDIAWILNLRGGDVDYNPFSTRSLLSRRKAQFSSPSKKLCRRRFSPI